IDIIDPLERIKNNLELMENNIYKLFDYRTFSKKRIKDIISKINSGFSYKNSDKIDDGIYKIFKISNIRKNDDNNIDKTNFTKNNLLNLGDVITGLSGVLGTAKIIYEKYWVSNQRTLSLTSENFLLIKKSIEKNEKKIYTLSTGSVQKNITVNDILNLELLEENLCDNELNKIFLEINIVKGKILKLKNQILKII
ncbi:restriction endonuclease subunit S domain-containing protein, partial [[Mycoplasma] collis]|uniref:hypothetical protein n=1 Tax=[Mycoplasma] collis TaxID=2127 RepID=UPI00051B2BAA